MSTFNYQIIADQLTMGRLASCMDAADGNVRAAAGALIGADLGPVGGGR